MKIELLFDNNWFVVGVRTNWTKKPANPPKPENVYEIPKFEFERLINFLAWRVVRKVKKWEKADFEYWNLRLVALDFQNPEVLKWKSFWNFIKYN